MSGKLRKIAAANFKKRLVEKAVSHLALLLGGALAGFLALVLAYCIPTEPMKEHIYYSMPMLEKEFFAFEIVTGYPGSLPGNFTDCLMLENAVYQSDGRTMLEQILRMYRGESGTGDGWAPGSSLIDYLGGAVQPREAEYARYWHGYLVVLKPLLFFTTVNSIRVMSAAFQLILVGVIVLILSRRREEFLAAAFLASMPFLYYFGLYASLSLSICFYVMTGLVLAQLKWEGCLRRRGWYGEFFLAAGMLTAYFDFLTYPLITLGFPLCICLYLDRDGAKRGFSRLVGYSAEWGIGYLGLWALKWVLADALAGGNTVENGLRTLLIRTNAASQHTRAAGFFSVAGQNLSVYCNWGFYLLGLGIALWLLGAIRRRKREIAGQAFWEGVTLFVVAAYPFAWFFLAQNHSEQHWMYTFKIFAVTVFAGICGVGKMCGHTAQNVPDKNAV